MTHDDRHLTAPTPTGWARRHPWAGVAGVAVGCIWLALVVALFGVQSSAPWLSDNPGNQTLAAQCRQQPQRAAQRECMQHLARLARRADRQGVELAANGPTQPPSGARR